MLRFNHSAAAAAIVALLAATSSPQPGNAQRSTNEAFAAFARSLTAVPDSATLTNRGAFYVPAYSSLRIAGGRTRLDLSVTLSIHNASETEALVINRIDYFDTFGSLIQHYLTQPIARRPFGTVEVFIPAEDVRGGTGANFVVGWAAKGPIEEPVVETVMAAHVGTAGVAFATHGRPMLAVQANPGR